MRVIFSSSVLRRSCRREFTNGSTIVNSNARTVLENDKFGGSVRLIEDYSGGFLLYPFRVLYSWFYAFAILLLRLQMSIVIHSSIQIGLEGKSGKNDAFIKVHETQSCSYLSYLFREYQKVSSRAHRSHSVVRAHHRLPLSHQLKKE